MGFSQGLKEITWMVPNSMPNTEKALQKLVLSHLRNEGVLFNDLHFWF